jgi:two-component system phosphate regulon response regulator OmpR
MKAAPHNKYWMAATGPIKNGRRQALHAPRRRVAQAGSMRQVLDEQAAQQGKRVPLLRLELGARRQASTVPRVLLVDSDGATAMILTTLLVPEAQVVHVPTLAAARQALRTNIFSAVVLDPSLPDGDAASLLPALYATPLLVYSAQQPEWREAVATFLPKPWTSPRQLWVAISGMLGIAAAATAAGD